MQAKEIIRLFGGIRPMQTALGHKNASTVQYWADKGIPHWRYGEILEAARKHRIKLAKKDLANGNGK